MSQNNVRRSGLKPALLAFLLLGGSHIIIASDLTSTGELRQTLNGQWQFTTNAAVVGSSDAKWDAITVPGNWDTLPAYATHKGKGWYRREFVVPVDWSGKHIRLKFDAVYHDATVTLNGQELGSHNGGYTPFEFDVTARIKLGATNTVTVCADNTFRRGAWWAWGGISRSVTLIANEDTRIVWQHIRTGPDLQRGTARIFVRYKLANAGAKRLKVSLASTIDGAKESALAKNVSLPAGGEAIVELETTLSKQRVRLWHFDHPNLYRLTTQLSVGGKVVHEQTDRFGIRKVEVTQDSLLLNGERVRVNGYNRISDSRKFGSTEPDELVKSDVDLMKRANGNLTRLMHHPQAPNLLDYLDEKGMMIWCEIPVWGGDTDPNMTPNNPLARQWMSEMIERDFNHPCIIGWSVGNELEQHYDYVKSMMEFTRGLDPHRIVTHVSHTGARANANRTNDPITISPIALYNIYNYNRDAARIVHERWPEKAIFISEFGMGQFSSNLDARIPGLEELYRQSTVSHPYVIGVSLWTFNDYRSDYTNTPPSGNRAWGIVTEDRQPKAAYAQARKLFSPVQALESDGKTIRVVPRGAEEVPSFTLRGYQLRWRVSDIGGKIVKSGTVQLPDLKPNAPAWTMQLNDALSGVLEVELSTPTGYEVDELKVKL